MAGVGPQLSYFFPVTDKIQGVANVKAYWEFAAQNRPDGWNAWLTIASSPAPSKKPEDGLRERFPRFAAEQTAGARTWERPLRVDWPVREAAGV